MRAIDASTSSTGVDVAACDEVGEARCVVVVEEIPTISAHQFGMRPPLTMIVWPDTNAESSDRK